MKAVLQRVTSASVTVDKQLISNIGKGILVFAGVDKDDTPKEVEKMAAKVLKEKIWPDELGTNWKRSVVDIDGELLCVSQFTLMANTRKGAKPDFHSAANPEKGRELYDLFLAKVRALYVADRVKNGIFQAMMDVELVNDGPVGVDYRYEDGVVTLQIETNPPRSAKAENEAEEPSRSTFEMPASLLE